MAVACAHRMQRAMVWGLAAAALLAQGCGDAGVVRYEGSFECSNLDADQAYVQVDFDLDEVSVGFVPSAASPGAYVVATDPAADIDGDRIATALTFAAVDGEEAPLELEFVLERGDGDGGEELNGEGTLRRPDGTVELCSGSFAAGS